MWHTPRFPGRILLSPGDRGPTGSRRSSHQRRSAVFRLERLEDRTVLSTLIPVTSDADHGPGSLRQAIAGAAPGDTIVFAKNVHKITLTGGELQITNDLDIEGPGAKKLTISGNDSSRVFDILSGTVTIAGLTITDGLANGSSPVVASLGGGILNSANLVLSGDVLSDNQALGDASTSPLGFAGGGLGGGIQNYLRGTLTVTDCRFINNQALGASRSSGSLAGFAAGGGIANSFSATAIVTDSLFAGNVARGGSVGSVGSGGGNIPLVGLGFGGGIGSGGTLRR